MFQFSEKDWANTRVLRSQVAPTETQLLLKCEKRDKKSQQPLKVVVGDNNNNKNLGLILVWTSNSFAPGYKRYVSKLFQTRRPLFVWAKTNKGLLVDWNKEETSLSEWGVVTTFGEALLYLKCSTADIYSNERRELERRKCFSVFLERRNREKRKLGFAFHLFSQFKDRIWGVPDSFSRFERPNGRVEKSHSLPSSFSLCPAAALF